MKKGGNKDIKNLNVIFLQAKVLSTRFRFKKALKLLDKIIVEEQKQLNRDDLQTAAKMLYDNITKRLNIYRYRMFIIAVFLFVVCVIFTMQSIEVRYTEVLLDVKSEGLYFELSEKNYIGGFEFESLILSDSAFINFHADSIYVFPQSGKEVVSEDYVKIYPNPRNLTSLVNRADNAIKISGENLELDYFELSPYVPISFEHTLGSNSTLSITEGSNSTYGQIRTSNTTIINCDECTLEYDGNRLRPKRVIVFHNLKQLEFFNDNIAVPVSFVLNNNENEVIELSKNVFLLNELDFSNNKRGTPISTIENCEITFSNLDEKKMNISEKEFLFLDKLKNFYITNVELGSNFNLRIMGKVGTIESGTGSKLFSRKPSILESIAKSADFNLIVAAVSGLFTIVLSAFFKLKIFKQ